MRDKNLGLLAVAALATACLTLPAHADLRMNVVAAGDQATRSAGEADAGNRNFFSDVGHFFHGAANSVAHGFEQGAHAVEHAADKVAHGKWGHAASEAGQQIGHGHVGQGLGTIGHAVEQTDYVQGMEKVGKHIYHGHLGEAEVALGQTVINTSKYVTRPNAAIDVLQDLGVNVPNVKAPDFNDVVHGKFNGARD